MNLNIFITGFVTLTNNKERTLRLFKGSHQLHENYFTERGIKSTSNWHRIEPSYLDTIEDRKLALQIPAGSLVLWDSRVFHQNQYGEPNSEERIVQYVCYFPKNHPKYTNSIKSKKLNLIPKKIIPNLSKYFIQKS